MKKVILLALVACVLLPATASMAQVDSYIEMLRTDVRAEKVAVIDRS